MDKEYQEIKDQLKRIEQITLIGAKDVLTFDDVHIITGFSKSHLYKLTCSRQIPHYKPNGKQVYFDKQEINDWLRQNPVVTDDHIDQLATNYIVTGNIERAIK